MNIAVAGYGKMGHMIAAAARGRGHTVCLTADVSEPDADVRVTDAAELAKAVASSGAEGVIEFTNPSSAAANIAALLPLRIPVITGTTGWKDRLGELTETARSCGGFLLHSSNFSIGVNLFYRITERAAQLMNEFDEYDCAICEAHHNQKADSPSGTANELARLILENCTRKTTVVTEPFDRAPRSDELHVASLRVGSVPGTHTVVFDSASDTVELTHRARSRAGFASGAVRALEWLSGRIASGAAVPGAYTMDDVLDGALH